VAGRTADQIAGETIAEHRGRHTGYRDSAHWR
jgi:hypothetical protein